MYKRKRLVNILIYLDFKSFNTIIISYNMLYIYLLLYSIFLIYFYLMIFSKSYLQISIFIIIISNSLIEHKEEARFFGVIIDDSLHCL